MLYRVRIGRDEYLGTADEVVGFLTRAEGAPGRDPRSYMEGVARRLRGALPDGEADAIATDDPVSFLESVGATGLIRVETVREPSDDREDPDDLLRRGPVTLGEGVGADDVDLPDG
jgi:hypothetical protein